MDFKNWTVIRQITFLHISFGIGRRNWIACCRRSLNNYPVRFFDLCLRIFCVPEHNKVNSFHPLRSICDSHLVICITLNLCNTAVVIQHAAPDPERLIRLQLWFQQLVIIQDIAAFSDNLFIDRSILGGCYMRGTFCTCNQFRHINPLLPLGIPSADYHPHPLCI